MVNYTKSLKRFLDFYNNLDGEVKEKISYMIVDATPQISASKA